MIEMPSKSNKGSQKHKAQVKPVPTKWDIYIKGIIFHPTGRRSVALIRDNSARSIKAFSIGNSMFKKATLVDIKKDMIIFERKGVLEYKSIKDRDIPTTPAKKFTETEKVAVSQMRSRFVEPGFKRVDNDITMTEAYRQNLVTKDLTKIMYQAMAMPRKVNGKIDGFTISEIEPGSIYEKAGILNNDVITNINGERLVDAGKAIALLNALREESEITLDIERKGKVQKLYMRVK